MKQAVLILSGNESDKLPSLIKQIMVDPHGGVFLVAVSNILLRIKTHTIYIKGCMIRLLQTKCLYKHC